MLYIVCRKHLDGVFKWENSSGSRRHTIAIADCCSRSDRLMSPPHQEIELKSGRSQPTVCMRQQACARDNRARPHHGGATRWDRTLDGRRRVGNSWVGRIAASWEKNCTFRGLSNPHGGIASAPVQKVSRSARLISVPSSEKQTCSYGTTENITTGKFYSPCTTCCKFTLDCSVSNGKLSQILSNFSHNFLQWKLHKTG